MIKVRTCPATNESRPGPLINTGKSTVSKTDKNAKGIEDLVKQAAAGGPILPSSDWFEINTLEPARGSWYFGSECPHCHRAIAVVRDFSDSKLGTPFSGTGGLLVTCNSCQKPVRIPMSQIAPFQLG
jgi:hypothetical protein